MHCPLCGAGMLSGRASIAPSTMSTIVNLIGGAGTAPSYLYFAPGSGSGPSVHLDHTRRSFRCMECEAVLISGIRKEEQALETESPDSTSGELPSLSCPACGCAVTADVDRCPSCRIALK